MGDNGEALLRWRAGLLRPSDDTDARVSARCRGTEEQAFFWALSMALELRSAREARAASRGFRYGAACIGGVVR